MSLTTHVGSAKTPKINFKTKMSSAAKASAAALKKRADARAERTATRQGVQRKSTRLGDLSGRALNSGNLTSMCQVALIRSGKSFTRIAEEQGISAQTASRLLYGRTKRVSAATMLAALDAGGITLEMRDAH